MKHVIGPAGTDWIQGLSLEFDMSSPISKEKKRETEIYLLTQGEERREGERREGGGYGG